MSTEYLIFSTSNTENLWPAVRYSGQLLDSALTQKALLYLAVISFTSLFSQV